MSPARATPARSAKPTWTTAGKYGKALTFDGVNDWVTINDANDLDLPSAMTLEAWVYPTRNTAWRTAVMKENGSDLAWALYSSGSAKPSAWAATGTGMGSTTGPTAPALNAWTHMAATYDGTNLRLFVNGTQVANAARDRTLATGTGALRLGGNGIWSEWFTGRLDDIRIYDRALTPTQIQTDMNTPAGAAPPPPAPTRRRRRRRPACRRERAREGHALLDGVHGQRRRRAVRRAPLAHVRLHAVRAHAHRDAHDDLARRPRPAGRPLLLPRARRGRGRQRERPVGRGRRRFAG